MGCGSRCHVHRTTSGGGGSHARAVACTLYVPGDTALESKGLALLVTLATDESVSGVPVQQWLHAYLTLYARRCRLRAR